MKKHDIPDEEKDRIAQMNADHYCKLYCIKDPDKKSEVLKAMRQACDEIELEELEDQTVLSVMDEKDQSNS